MRTRRARQTGGADRAGRTRRARFTLRAGQARWARHTRRADGADRARFTLRTGLALRADLLAGLSAVRTAFETARLEDRNQALADEQLRLAQEQYRVGLVSFLELVEAETVKAQADRERLAAIYQYHDSLANLEAVVGQPLRAR